MQLRRPNLLSLRAFQLYVVSRREIFFKLQGYVDPARRAFDLGSRKLLLAAIEPEKTVRGQCQWNIGLLDLAQLRCRSLEFVFTLFKLLGCLGESVLQSDDIYDK